MKIIWKNNALRVQGNFEDVVMLHKIDELLHTTKLLTNLDAIPNSTGDSEVLPTPHPPYFPYETADFSSILDSISTFIFFSYMK
jgi:hypothetical protein